MRIAIIGVGNGGQTAAGHLSLSGNEVRIYDINKNRLDNIAKNGGIELTNQLSGFAKNIVICSNIEETIKDCKLIIVITTAWGHHKVAADISDFVEDGQMILLIPGYWGAFEFHNIFEKNKVKKDVIIGEYEILPYAVRCIRDGKLDVRGIKKVVKVAALSSSRTEELYDTVKKIYPNSLKGENILEVDLNNINPMFHPSITLFNAGIMEEKKDHFFYPDGTSKRVAHFIQKIDNERLEIGEKLNLKLSSVQELLLRWYGVKEKKIYDGIHNNIPYQTGKAPKDLTNHRYIFEDFPYGLVPLANLARGLEITTPYIDSLINTASLFMDVDLRDIGLSLDKLGFSNKDFVSEITNFVK